MTAPGAFPKATHDHGKCCREAMTKAERLCDSRGVRLTELRRRVLAAVWSSHRPVGAYDILSVLAEERGGKAQPPTVYRALEFLQAQGLVHRVESLNAFVGCDTPELDHRSQFLLCRDCGKAAELVRGEGMAALERDAAALGFQVEGCTVEVTGLCPDCQVGEGGVAS